MKCLRLTRKQYGDLDGIRGGLVLLAIRIFVGIIISFYNAFLMYSYISWGFQLPDFYPVIFIMLGFLYFIDTLLLFHKRQAFVAMYVITAAAFIVISASLGGYGFLFYAGLEVLPIVYLMRSKRAAVNFRTKKIEIIDRKYMGTPIKLLPQRAENIQNKRLE